MPSFQLVGLPFEPFARYFSLSDGELGDLGMRRVIATEQPGYPCRVSLTDAAVGEELLLLPYAHQPENSPYRASGPIFVRRNAQQCVLGPGAIPDCVTLRLMSVRAYDSSHFMTGAEVCEGSEVGRVMQEMFSRQNVAYVHLHNAKRGCFSCCAIRVSEEDRQRPAAAGHAVNSAGLK